MNTNSAFDQAYLDRVTRPESRLPFIEAWLLEDVWTWARFINCDGVPSQYLESGETLVNQTESLLTASADSYFRELCADPAPSRTVTGFFNRYERGCVLILDGCSLREIPRLHELAQGSGRPILETGSARSAIPSNTENFIGSRLGLGLPVISPSQLVSRRDLKQQGIQVHLFKTPDEHQVISQDGERLLIWHRFPDGRFMDSTASNSRFYDGIWDSLELVWKRTVQALPHSRHVLVTSDHGYAFFGPGLSDRNLDGKDRPLKGKRFRKFQEDEPLPAEAPELFIDRETRIAVIQGRCHNRPQAPSPSQSLFRHEGISLMEVLTPWLVMGPMEV